MEKDADGAIWMDGQGAARLGGMFLLLTAVATAVAVIARVVAGADQETLLESLLAVDDNRAMYGVSGGARLLAGVTLFAAGWFLWRTWIIREGFGTRWVPYLLGCSGVWTAVSGALVLVVAAYPEPQAAVVGGVLTGDVAGTVEAAWDLRWITNKVGFAIAGAALMLAAWQQFQVGGTLSRIAPVSAMVGLAMQFIWIDGATLLHPVVGVAFLLWLVAIGSMLATGRVEGHFIRRWCPSSCSGTADRGGRSGREPDKGGGAGDSNGG